LAAQLGPSALPAKWGTARVPRSSQQPAASPPRQASQPSPQNTTPMPTRKSPSHSSAARPSIAQRPEGDAFVPPAASSSTPSRQGSWPWHGLRQRLHTRSPPPPLSAGRPFHSSLSEPPRHLTAALRASILQSTTRLRHLAVAVASEHTIHPASLTNPILHATHHRSRLTQSHFSCCAGLLPYNCNPPSISDTKRNFRRHGVVSRLLPLLRQADRSRCLLLSSLPTR